MLAELLAIARQDESHDLNGVWLSSTTKAKAALIPR